MAIEAVRGVSVFSAAGRSYSWTDIVDAARAWGEWAVLEQHAAETIAAEREAARAGRLPSAAAVTDVANAFRYTRKLLAADELKQWLAKWDVTVGEWYAYLRRTLMVEPELVAEFPVASEDEVARSAWVEAVCSGSLESFARRLAEQVAVHVGAVADGVPPADAGELSGLGREFELFCARRVTEGAVAAEIASNLLGWTRMDCLYVSGDETVLREAALCVTEDGRDLREVAADAGVALHEASFVLDDAELRLRTRLLAASPGQLLGPVPVGDEDHWLILIVGRVPPSVEDLSVRVRARRRIVAQALEAEVSRNVTWHDHL